MEWFIKVLHQYADFKGRARRKEFWMFGLFYILFACCAAFADKLMNTEEYYLDDMLVDGVFSSIYALALFIPCLAVSVRRLHDTGKSGWMILVGIIPFVGWLWLLVLYCENSQRGNNAYGPNPKGEWIPQARPENPEYRP